ncbi:MAG: alpha-D-glucose phosphate-specific phosphoglucomutase [Polyangiaceae bacterium]|nr:alpha-D-glucose phosphate-specific phosphoglucomutase [Polyangiaceae bacterium]
MHPLAGKPAPRETLVDVPALVRAYDAPHDHSDPTTHVSFGTSGHRGSALRGSFQDAHVAAITQAVAEWRAAHGVDGPLYLGADTHALSGPAEATAAEVLAGNDVTFFTSRDGVPTPTPAVSLAILTAQRRGGPRADGLILTPSHNPPEDGGIKYNPPHGGPADTDVTRAIEARANALLAAGNAGVRRRVGARGAPFDYVACYASQLPRVLDVDALRGSRLRVGADPLGGSAIGYWDAIAAELGLSITVTDRTLDPAFGFMPLDHDGRIRMDCSSPSAMARLVGLRGSFDVAFGNDADADRHGIVTPEGLMNPNHYLAVCVDYLFRHRPAWGAGVGVGKTLVSSALIDRVAARLGRPLFEVPVGFKWFVPGLSDGSLGFAGEESAGASLLCRDGAPWTTDKDGLVLALLAVEMTARSGVDPSARYAALAAELGAPVYRRVDRPATREQKARLSRLGADAVTATTLAGAPILSRLTTAPAGGAIGGLKVSTADGWFAARPSGTEDQLKIYAESFRGDDHLAALLEEAGALVARAVG